MCDENQLKPANPKPASEFTVYSLGIVFASVCTRLSIEEATQRINSRYPTGIESKWALSEEPTFNSGAANGCQCPDDPRNKHYLFNC